MNNLNLIVNLDLHPINKSGKYINFCHDKLKKDSFLMLDNFLLPESLKNIQNEGRGVFYVQDGRSHYCIVHTTALRVPGLRNRLPEKLHISDQSFFLEYGNERLENGVEHFLRVWTADVLKQLDDHRWRRRVCNFNTDRYGWQGGRHGLKTP